MEDYKLSKGIYWACKCDCGNEKIIITNTNNLKSGKVKSCGCYAREQLIQRNVNGKKYNTYNLTGTYGIGYTTNTNEEFYFDLEDYGKIKDYCWRIGVGGYITHSYNNILIHRVIMDLIDKEYEVDHINYNLCDNRKINLRICNHNENSYNRRLRKDNKSGVIGVCWLKRKNKYKWVVGITVNKKHISLGSFDDKVKAITTRLQAEVKYFGKFAPQKHLYEQYGIIQQLIKTN